MTSISATTLQNSMKRPQFNSPSEVENRLSPDESVSVRSRSGFSPVCRDEISGKATKFSGWVQLLRRRSSLEFPATKASDTDAAGHGDEKSNGVSKPTKSFVERLLVLIPEYFSFVCYLLIITFNEKAESYLPYRCFDSAIHLVYGVGYCLLSRFFGIPEQADLLPLLATVAFSHAVGLLVSKISFAAVAFFPRTMKGTKISTQNGVGAAVAIVVVTIYFLTKAYMEGQRGKAADKAQSTKREPENVDKEEDF